MECWNIWVFHAFVPKQKTLRARSIPPQFNEVCNGHINWKTPESEPPSHSPNIATFQQQSSNSESSSSSSSSSSYDSKMIHGLFHRALDNLVDRALLPLSIVRFGFRQWITLSGLPTTTGAANSQTSEPQTQTDHLERSQPLTPTSPALDLSSEAQDFIAASTMLESSTRDFSDQKAETSTQSLPHTTYVLRFTTSISTRAILLQPDAQPVPSLYPVTDSINELAARTKPLHQQQISEDQQQWPALAAARIVPYGIPADIISVPETHSGESEERTLDAWSRAFGYPREFLTISDSSSSQSLERSNLLWIRISIAKEPLLYPRKLVLIDKSALSKSDQTPKVSEHMESVDDDANASLESASVKVNDGSQQDSSHEQRDHLDEIAAKTDKGLFSDEEEGEEEGEEGEEAEEAEEAEEGEELGEEEGEYDEEGEIAGDSSSADPTINSNSNGSTNGSSNADTINMVSAELDTIVAELRTATSLSMEKSLAAIQESMTLFQAELRIEQEQEEARKREKLEKERATTAQGILAETSKSSSSKSAGGSGSRKRPRSNTRDEPSGNNKTRRKSVSTANSASKQASTQVAASSVDTPSQVATPDDSIPLAQTLLNGLADSAASVAVISNGASGGEVDSLFGGAAIGEVDAGVSGLDGNVPVLGGENSDAPEGDMGL
ncbi:hypothetical protein FB639_004107, partial [Coemansia asiatica]